MEVVLQAVKVLDEAERIRVDGGAMGGEAVGGGGPGDGAGGQLVAGGSKGVGADVVDIGGVAADPAEAEGHLTRLEDVEEERPFQGGEGASYAAGGEGGRIKAAPAVDYALAVGEHAETSARGNGRGGEEDAPEFRLGS